MNENLATPERGAPTKRGCRSRTTARRWGRRAPQIVPGLVYTKHLIRNFQPDPHSGNPAAQCPSSPTKRTLRSHSSSVE